MFGGDGQSARRELTFAPSKLAFRSCLLPLTISSQNHPKFIDGSNLTSSQSFSFSQHTRAGTASPSTSSHNHSFGYNSRPYNLPVLTEAIDPRSASTRIPIPGAITKDGMPTYFSAGMSDSHSHTGEKSESGTTGLGLESPSVQTYALVGAGPAWMTKDKEDYGGDEADDALHDWRDAQ